jgi:uncharacterized membrane protein
MKLSLLLTSGLMAGLLTGALRAEESSTQLKFSDPSKPGTLKVNLEGGDLKIVGSAEATGITVVSDAKANSGQKRSDGLRVLSASTSFSLTEKDNVAVLEAGYGRRHGNTSSYKITLPKNTAVIVGNLYGDTSCVDLSGDVDVRSSIGAVTLNDVQAGASVETMNGSIHVTVKTLLPAHALSFSSMNGEIVIHLPEDAKANLQLRTQNGSILTDYDDKELVATSTNDQVAPADESKLRDAVREAAEATREAARRAREAVRESLSEGGGHPAPVPPLPPLPPMTGGQTVSGVLHGGGTDVQAATMNGDVTVRKG